MYVLCKVLLQAQRVIDIPVSVVIGYSTESHLGFWRWWCMRCCCCLCICGMGVADHRNTLPWLQVRYIEWSVLEDRVLHHVSGYYRHELLYDLVSTRSHLNAKHRAAARQNNPAKGRWAGVGTAGLR